MMPASFVLSAASASDFPATELPEIAMVGRSNVGKSTLINALVRQPLARTSAAPGKTRLANYYLIEAPHSPPFYLVDLPGYGYARGGQGAADEFNVLTAQFFESPEKAGRQLGGVLHLVDARHPELPQDLAAHSWISATGLPVALVATKMDKLRQSERSRLQRTLGNRYAGSILMTSSPDGGGVGDVWKLLREWTARRR